jgi:hypothetical protein
MRGRLRHHLLGLACVAAAGVVAVAAIVDHRWKQHRLYRAEVAEWYCTHRGTRCGGTPWETIEARWNRRQVGYEVAVTVLATAGAGLIGIRALRPARGRAAQPVRRS